MEFSGAGIRIIWLYDLAFVQACSIIIILHSELENIEGTWQEDKLNYSVFESQSQSPCAMSSWVPVVEMLEVTFWKKFHEETSLYKWSEKYADLVYAVLGFSSNIKHQHCTQRNSICLCCINKRLAGSQRQSYWENKLKNSKYNFVTSWSKKKN